MPNLIGGIVLGYIWKETLDTITRKVFHHPFTYSVKDYGFWGLLIVMCWQLMGYMMIIYIAGIQVGEGYIGKKELTEQRFLNNPFGPGKIYKSGDIGRWTFDGKIQCLGRIDNQIKLRGLRIELSEIEDEIAKMPGVSSCVVNKITLDNKECLCAYYVCDTDLTEQQIKENLRKFLPQYMIPTHVVKLDSMPYTINRKIDRKALPLPKVTHLVDSGHIDISSLNSNEEKLTQIWKSILKVDNIDVNDNFFDIGGDSISAINMQIEALKYGLEFEYADIFKSVFDNLYLCLLLTLILERFNILKIFDDESMFTK